MLDKMTRVENMVTKLSCLLDINEDTQQAIREAASLAMSGLATSVVTEFTALSGVTGRHYALRDGYSEQVVQFAMSYLAILFGYRLIILQLLSFSCHFKSCRPLTPCLRSHFLDFLGT
jgi:hypothetical protein